MAKKKFEIYLRTRDEQVPVGEILREYGVHTSQLREIEQSVEHWAIHAPVVKDLPSIEPARC